MRGNCAGLPGAEEMGMNAWDATTYEGKETILRVVRDEAARLTELAGRPGAWESSWASPSLAGIPAATGSTCQTRE